MITLTRLSGSRFVLNSDLIERIDSTPDTVVSLIDGKKYVVSEAPEQIVEAIRSHRGEVVALSTRLSRVADEPGHPSFGLPDEPVEDRPGHRLAAVAELRPRRGEER
ncbi:MAG TPA: flagellar FlbD family protein [Nocardioides sp.]